MRSRQRFIVGLMIGACGCAQIVQSDREYVLIGDSSASAAGGAGAMGGAGSAGGKFEYECMTSDDCSPSGNACKATACTNGFCTTHNLLEGTICLPGSSNVCDGLGTCVECTLAEHCVDIVEDQCIKRACVNHECQKKYLGPESPASPALQQPGDCQIIVCDGIGGTRPLNDDADSPDDDNGCTIDTCLNGSEVHTKVVTGTGCGTNSYCNEIGQCVGCLSPMDCAGFFDACKQPTCTDGICGVSYTTEGTPLPANEQTPQDCFVVVCDGMGDTVTKVDMNDFLDDGNACTRDSCGSDGTSSNSPEPAATPCGDGVNDFCDGFGTCKLSNGKTCNTAKDCASGHCVDGVCCASACDASCSACNVSAMTAGTCTLIPLGLEDGNAGLPCTGSSSCDGNGACRKERGQSCAMADDCLDGFCVDGYCCENACNAQCKACNVSGALGTCANVPQGSVDNNATVTCNNTQACDGNGTCKLANGQSCTSNSQCASGKCKNGQNKCQP